MSGKIQSAIAVPAKGFKGGVANSNPQTTQNETAEAVIGVGKFCQFGSTGLVPLTDITQKPLFALKSDAFDGSEFAIGDAVTVCKGGDVFAYVETACTKGENAFVRCVVNADLEIGDVRADADTDKAVEMTNIKFGETLSGAGLVKIEIN